mmetsp:Transcript_6173/g.11649  ORF Transcript_6173/g.11649 Transcript_6173/m.11649 type:complete len:106 (-) Transcript_6173:1503-1820(-)
MAATKHWSITIDQTFVTPRLRIVAFWFESCHCSPTADQKTKFSFGLAMSSNFDFHEDNDKENPLALRQTTMAMKLRRVDGWFAMQYPFVCFCCCRERPEASLAPR